MSGWYEEPKTPIERPGKKPPAARRMRAPRTTLNKQGRNGQPLADDTRCGAKKQDGNPCTQVAGWGTDHPGYGPCKHHMGSTPQGRKSGAHDMAAELMLFYGAPVDTNPIDALLDEVRTTAGHKAYLGKLISTFRLSLTELKPGDDLPELPPNVAGWLSLYMSERQQLVRVSKAALDAGVNERLVQLAEHQGALMASGIEEILSRLNLTPEQQALVPKVVPDVLRGLMAGAPKLIEGTIEEQDV